MDREREALDRLEEEQVAELLALIDDPTPDVTPDSVIARARRRERGRHAVRAAGVVLALALAGGAYAAPNSPLPGLLARLVTPAVQSPPPSTAGQDEVLSGIVLSAHSPLEIAFTRFQDDGIATIYLEEAAGVRVEVRGATASLDSDIDRLVIDAGDGSPDYSITIPIDAIRVDVLVGGASVFVKDGDGIRTRTSPSADGSYRISLARPRRP